MEIDEVDNWDSAIRVSQSSFEFHIDLANFGFGFGRALLAFRGFDIELKQSHSQPLQLTNPTRALMLRMPR